MSAILWPIFSVVTDRNLSRYHLANSETSASQIVVGKVGDGNQQMAVRQI